MINAYEDEVVGNNVAPLTAEAPTFTIDLTQLSAWHEIEETKNATCMGIRTRIESSGALSQSL